MIVRLRMAATHVGSAHLVLRSVALSWRRAMWAGMGRCSTATAPECLRRGTGGGEALELAGALTQHFAAVC